VAGVDDLFNEKMRMVVEYMQYRELSSDIKRKVRGGRGASLRLRLAFRGRRRKVRVCSDSAAAVITAAPGQRVSKQNRGWTVEGRRA
jgi:hypothetical protein